MARKINRIRIFDIDGVLVDSTHRYRTIIDETGERIDLQYWRENEFKAMDDVLLPFATVYQDYLKCPETFVIVATAREMNGPDWQYVQEVLGEPDHFIFRPKGSAVTGKLLKLAGLRRLLSLKQFREIRDVVFFEDNIQYLKHVCDNLGIQGVYIPSKQGH